MASYEDYKNAVIASNGSNSDSSGERSAYLPTGQASADVYNNWVAEQRANVGKPYKQSDNPWIKGLNGNKNAYDNYLYKSVSSSAAMPRGGKGSNGGNGGAGGGSGTGGNNWQDSLAEQQKAAQIADLYDQYKNGMITRETFATKSGQTVEQYEMSQKPTYSMIATPDTKKAEADAEALAKEDAYRRYLNKQITADQFYYETGILPQDYVSQRDASTPITPQTSSNGRTYSASSRPSSGAGAYSEELAADKAKQDQINAGQQTFYTNGSMTADNPPSTGFGKGNFSGTARLETDSGTGNPQPKAKAYDPYAGYITDPVTEANFEAAYQASQTPAQPGTVRMPDAAQYGQERGEATANELATRQSELDFITNRYIAIGRSPEEARRLALEEVYNINVASNASSATTTTRGHKLNGTRKSAHNPETADPREQAMSNRFKEDYDRMKAQFPNYSDTALVDLILFSEMQNSGYETPYYQWVVNSLSSASVPNRDNMMPSR